MACIRSVSTVGSIHSVGGVLPGLVVMANARNMLPSAKGKYGLRNEAGTRRMRPGRRSDVVKMSNGSEGNSCCLKGAQ